MIRRMAFVSIGLLACASVHADFITGFEAPDYNASSAGVLLTGQQGWYLPVAGSADYLAFTYAGNAFGFPANPNGGSQLIAGQKGPLGPDFARAQRDEAFTEVEWILAFDNAWNFPGPLPAEQNLGSFSLQPFSSSRSFILLYTWVDEFLADKVNVGYLVFDSTSFMEPAPGLFPGPEWENLDVNHWYRFSQTVDFATNIITSVSITDLTTNVTTTVVDPINPFVNEPYYLQGGDDPVGRGFPLPTGYRFFTGGGGGGSSIPNTMAADNLSLTVAGGVCVGEICGDANCDGSFNGGDIDPFFVAVGTPAIWVATYPNCDIVCSNDISGDGFVNGGDIDPFFLALVGGPCLSGGGAPAPTPPPAPRLAPLRNGSVPGTTPTNEVN